MEEYISSGLIEAYILGLLTADEVDEVYNKAKEKPEIMMAIRNAEKAIEKLSQRNALEPPKYLRDKIMVQMKGCAIRGATFMQSY